MPGLKPLIYVLVIAAIVFRLSKPFAVLFITPQDLARRRKVWYALTIVAFLSPSFWLFVLVAIPVMTIAGRKDSNPSALYLMLLQVIPGIDVPVPMIGMPFLFIINNYFLLSICIMLPVALRILRSKQKTDDRRLDAMDFCLLAYGLLTAILYVHYESPDGGVFPGSITESLRRGLVFLLGIFIAYYSLRHLNSDRRKLVDSMASFCLACALMAAIAVFESARHWALYQTAVQWGYFAGSRPLTRGDSLRAMASSGHSLALGHLLVVALGFWLYLQTRLESAWLRIGVTVLYWAGLFAAYARGAWIGAVLVSLLFTALRPNPLSKILKASLVGALVVGLVYLSPLADRIISVMPFLGGQVDTFNVTYRDRLWDRAWQVIQQSPIWGDPAALSKMHDLRQGEGIIDLVNSYVAVLLGSGFVGLTLFGIFILIPLMKAWSANRLLKASDPDLCLMGASFVCCIIGTLLLIGSTSFEGASERLFYILAALGAAYAQVAKASQLPLRSSAVDARPAV